MNEVDVVIVGSGAGGLATALVAAGAGLKVLILEKTDLIGGATAYAAGGAFVPGARHLPPEESDDAMTYLSYCADGRLDRPLVEVLLRAGPEAFAYLEDHTEAAFQGYGGCDYRMEAPGARTHRTLTPVPFDGRRLGAWLKYVRPPLPSMTIFRGMQVDYADITRLLGATRSIRHFGYATRLLAGHVAGRLRYGRSPRLVFGNALVGRLLKSVLDRRDLIEIRRNAAVTGLIVEHGCVRGVRVDGHGALSELRAARGVVLACGGFPGDATMRATHMPFADLHLSLPPATNDGDGIRMATAAGARLSNRTISDYCYAPVSRLILKDGRDVRHPHFGLDRCLPGAILVGPDGRRFVNEAAAYSEIVPAMHAAGAVPAYLICDHAFLRRRGVGLVRPAPFPYRQFIRQGYLVRARTIDGLADRLAIPAEELRRSVARNNAFALSGIDEDFGKGFDAYSRSMGDPSHTPNPCIGFIAKGPFYAIRLYPGDTATTRGLAVDAAGRALGADDRPIEGLYAVGADMANPMLGTNPSGGCNIGPAVTFGYLAARDMAARQRSWPPD